MASRTKTAGLSRDGSSVVIQQHETDSPILPVAQMERLHKLDPDFTKFIIDQTAKEADFRREETKRTNSMVFTTMLSGQFCALIVGLIGVTGGCYIAYINPANPYAGAIIAVASVSGLAIAFISGRK